MLLLATPPARGLLFLLLLFFLTFPSGHGGRSAKYPSVRHERAPSLLGPLRARLGRPLRGDEHPVLLVQAIAVQERLAHRVQRAVTVGAPAWPAKERRWAPRAVDALCAARAVRLLCICELGGREGSSGRRIGICELADEVARFEAFFGDIGQYLFLIVVIHNPPPLLRKNCEFFIYFNDICIRTEECF